VSEADAIRDAGRPAVDGAVLLTTLGSLGDLYPVLGVARALDRAGVEVRLALAPDDCEVARGWGLPAHPVGPSAAEITRRTGRSRDEIAAAVFRDPSPVVNELLLPLMPRYVRETEALLPGSACICGTAFALHGPIAAERAGLPFLPLLLQPLLLMSALDPPRARPFTVLQPLPRTALGRGWNRLGTSIVRLELRRRHARPFRRLRRELGLPPHRGTPLLDPGGPDVPLRLALWSGRFSPLPADAPAGTVLTGFPPAPGGDLPPDVLAWLDDGPPPLVVTLGSIAQNQGGAGFWREAVETARRLDLRAVLLHGEASVPEGSDLLALPYAPHAPLFPRAAAIVHHGGIGTTAEAIRSGRPQLVVPVGDDQPDNAARLERLGLAATLPLRRFRAGRAAERLRALLARFDPAAASDLAAEVAAENGARAAATRIAGLIAARRVNR
jgi:UDP:flavonoid glycosyltransferase YjiC (YdhE family)